MMLRTHPRMANNGWKSAGIPKPQSFIDSAEDEKEVAEGGVDLEQLARDQIAKLIASKYKGHGMAVLVEAVLATPRVHNLSQSRRAGQRYRHTCRSGSTWVRPTQDCGSGEIGRFRNRPADS